MAANGYVKSWSSTLDCRYIVRSSFKITKVGIGGPLVNLDGEVIGMNFYDRRIGTPFLPWTTIDIIQAHFGEKSKAGEVGCDSDPSGAAFWKMDGDDSDCLSWWPVPVPCWRHTGDVDEDKFDDDDDGDGDGDDDELGFEPVAEPCWRHPDDVCKIFFEDDVMFNFVPRWGYKKLWIHKWNESSTLLEAATPLIHVFTLHITAGKFSEGSVCCLESITCPTELLTPMLLLLELCSECW